MKRSIITILLCGFTFACFGQTETDSTQQKTNPIIFIEGLFGYANGNLSGLTVGGEINFQYKKDLFTFRVQNHSEAKSLWFFPVNLKFSKINIDEYSLLYGKRFIDDNESYSISIGISNNIKHERVNENNENFWTNESYFGFPFELNIKWFKREKERYRILYGAVPVGKETGFGRSIGLKLYGNVAKTTYIGIGLTFGYGWHKKY
ncbi:MAG: hypothetical protein R2785_12460 [Flavobacteriaceae bacterium]